MFSNLVNARLGRILYICVCSPQQNPFYYQIMGIRSFPCGNVQRERKQLLQCEEEESGSKKAAVLSSCRPRQMRDTEAVNLTESYSAAVNIMHKKLPSFNNAEYSVPYSSGDDEIHIFGFRMNDVYEVTNNITFMKNQLKEPSFVYTKDVYTSVFLFSTDV
ncbi:hypothetical protein F2P81_011710 [Scophthalmus maximus]|uniref:Uncharacterized protein n=1 Tax=Scophthalmus maximus TaxID=52904 RepID=A0A6A4SWD2_SCOMX|nr:hypothetical protein F2P81_011710 [Scophthalmus maximus]